MKSSLLSIKKPCQYFDRSCKNTDRLTGFGKAHVDVNAIPSKLLSPIGKLVFYALAAETKGKSGPVALSDGELAEKCGVSRPSVIAGRVQLEEIGLIGKSGKPVKQIQAYRILHHDFPSATPKLSIGAESMDTSVPRKRGSAPKMCDQCFKLRSALPPDGVCKTCKGVNRTEGIAERVARRVVREEATRTA